MAILLAGDTVEREMVFTTEQREKLRVIMDGALNDCANRLVDHFKADAVKEVEEDDDDI